MRRLQMLYLQSALIETWLMLLDEKEARINTINGMLAGITLKKDTESNMCD